MQSKRQQQMCASAQARRLISSEETAIPGEVRSTYDNGSAYCGFVLLQQDAEDEGTMWHRYLFLYADAGEDACVLLQVDGRAKTEAGLAQQD